MQKKVVILLLLLSFLTSAIYAKGTLAGTTVQNRADIVYSLGGVDYNLSTNIDSFVVDQIVDIGISWQDNSAVEAGAGDNASVLTFLLTNQGNGDDNISLAYDHNTTSSSFIPLNPLIYIDSNANGIYDPTIDQIISNITLAADANATLFIVSDIPDSNLSAGSSSFDSISATSTTSANQSADRQDEVDVVVRTGTDEAEGEYRVRDYFLRSVKLSAVRSDDNQTHTGSIITYTIDLSIGGNSAGRTISGVVLEDVIPIGTVYQAGSLRLDGINLSDPADGDAGSYDGSKIRVDVGTLSGAIHKKVEFDVQVQ